MDGSVPLSKLARSTVQAMSDRVSCSHCGDVFARTELGWARLQDHIESRHPNTNIHTSIKEES